MQFPLNVVVIWIRKRRSIHVARCARLVERCKGKLIDELSVGIAVRDSKQRTRNAALLRMQASLFGLALQRTY